MPRFAALITLIILISLTMSAGILPAQEADSTETTEEKIEGLKKEGKFTEALELANQNFTLLKNNPESKAFEITDMELVITTLTQVLAFPDSVQQEMAEAWRMKDKVDTLYSEGDYRAATNKMQEQLEIFKKHLGSEHIEFVNGADILGQLFYAQGDYSSAGQYLRIVLDSRRKLLGNDHPKIAESINNLAVFHVGNNEYEEAGKLLKESLEIYNKLLGEEHIDILDVLHNLAHVFKQQRKYAEAEQYQRKALDIGEKELGEEHPELVVIRNSLATILHDSGNYLESESLHRKNLDISRRVHGDKHPETALCLHNLSYSIAGQGHLVEAETLLREAIAIRRDKLGEEHPYTLISITDLASLLGSQGKYAESEKIHRETLSIKRKKYGDEHSEVAVSLHNLAAVLHRQGNYAAAEPLLRESLEQFRKNPEYESSSIAMNMSNLASLLRYQRNYVEAAELHREVLAMRRKMLGEKHANIAASMSGLAVCLGNLGEDSEAERLYREALVMRRELVEEDDLEIAITIGNLAGFLANRNRHDEAVVLMKEALGILRRLLGDKHPKVAQCTNNLGVVLSSIKDYAGAVKCWQDALQIQREILNVTNPELIDPLMNYGRHQYESGDYETAASLLTEAADIYDAARVRAGSGIARARFENSPHPWLAAAQLKQEKLADAWLSVEGSFGRVLGDLLLTAGKRSLSPEEKSEEDRLRQELTQAERELAVYKTSPQTDSEINGGDDQEKARGRLLAAQSAWSNFQRKMVRKYPVSEGQTFPLERVQKTIQQDEAILGWLDLSFRSGDEHNAWVYVIRSQGPVQWTSLKLVDEKTGNFQKKFRDELEWPTQEVSAEVEEICEAISKERVWPAMSMLEGVKNLVVIPSGPMLRVPVETLTDDHGSLLSERFVISYIPSSTIHAWLQEQPGSKHERGRQKILLIGDPPFCTEHLEAMNRESSDPVPLGADVMDVAAVRSVLSGNRDAITSMSRLPASRDEVETISAMSAQAHVLVGPEASEQNLERLASSGDLAEYDVIHVATHALVDAQSPEKSALILSQVDLPDEFEAVAKGERVYNGMVTVKDIIREWNLNADLVTLSACETGLGLKVSGEGYVGFMHAFLQVGARSLVVSLWKVDDRATSLLMQRFYRNYLGTEDQAMTKAQALQEAKTWLRSYTDKNGDIAYAHPAYWSGFILVGARE